MIHGLLLVVSSSALLLGTACASLAASPPAYSAAEIRGWVVDAETKQPLEGVHVVAQWILQTGILHSRRVTRFHILETITDAKGEYYFPAWGPKPRPTFASLDTGFDPLLTFFKPGYRALDRSNGDEQDRPLRTSHWHGKTIALDRFRGGLEDWAYHLRSVQTGLAWGTPADTPGRPVNDYWRYFPSIVLRILDERRALPEQLRYVVSDLQTWDVTEENVRFAATQKGIRQ